MVVVAPWASSSSTRSTSPIAAAKCNAVQPPLNVVVIDVVVVVDDDEDDDDDDDDDILEFVPYEVSAERGTIADGASISTFDSVNSANAATLFEKGEKN